MTPRRILGLSAVLLSTVFVALLILQGRGLPQSQLVGILFASVMSFALSALVLRARTFQGAARAYIAVLSIAVVGSVAAAATRQKLGDVVGALGAIAAALICASQAVARLRAPIADDAVISANAIAVFQDHAARIQNEVSEALQALSEATDLSEPFVLERLSQLSEKVSHAERWAQRLQLRPRDEASRVLASARRRLSRV
ncbi:MAG: hypothetical protein ACJ790_23265 [Myxococcaceae bacterium]